MLALYDAGTLEIEDGLPGLGAVGRGIDQLSPAGAGHLVFHRLVEVAVSVTGNGDGLLPVLHHRGDTLYHDGGAEHGAVQDGPDGGIGGLPHLGELVLLHPLGVGGDGGTLDRHAVLPGGLGGVHRHLVAGALPLGQAQVKIDGIQFDVRLEQDFFDIAPQDTGHLVAVHLHQRCCHFDLVHRARSSLAYCFLF